MAVESNKDEFFFHCTSSIKKLLGDEQIMGELLSSRNKKSIEKIELSENLRKCLEKIFETFKPLALGLIKKRMRKFPNMDSDTCSGIENEQYARLWNLIAFKFRWQNFSNASDAAGSFISYLNKSTGSFFAREVVEEGNLTRISDEKNTIGQGIRHVEEIVISNIDSTEKLNFWTTYLSTSSNKYIDVVKRHYVDDISTTDLAKELGISEKLLIKYLCKGKKF